MTPGASSLGEALDALSDQMGGCGAELETLVTIER